MNAKKILIGVSGGSIFLLFAIFLLSSPHSYRETLVADKSQPTTRQDIDRGDQTVSNTLTEQHQEVVSVASGDDVPSRATDLATNGSTISYQTRGARFTDSSATVSADPVEAPSQPNSATAQGNTQPPPVYLPTASLPAPFLPPPTNRNWSDDDLAAVAALAQDFTNSVINSAQNRADPNYAHTWLTAEWLANERYRSYYGVEAFNASRNPDG